MAHIYFSNDLKRLAESLGKELFSSGDAPFLRRTIVVPSDRYKGFLQRFFAESEEFQIAMGMEIVTMSSYLAVQCTSELKKSFPSYILLEHRLFCLAKNIEPLKGYSDRQLKTVCRELSHVFHKYGAHGENFLRNWLKKSGWQQTLWRAVYEDTSWSYPVEVFEKTKKLQSRPHLFGFSSMPPAQAQFFKKHDAIFYLFSPCRLFWSDLLGAKERAYLALENEDPTLLSSWGKWGKRLLNALSAEEMETREEYVEPNDSHLLGALQKSLFDLEPPQVSSAPSIRIFSARHPGQEIEELNEEIHRLLQEREDLLPSDILVLSPDIDTYVPYIHAVFGNKENGFDYTICGIERGKRSPLAKGIELLFNLIDREWSLEAIIELFNHSLFAEKRRWQRGDLELIEQWFFAAKTTWGFNSAQRKQFLHAEQLKSEAGTFRFAIDRLLLGLTSTTAPEAPQPLPQVGWADVELFSAVVETLETLAKDLESAIAGELKPLHAWIDWLLENSSRHFADEEEPWMKEELTKIRQECSDWEQALFTWRDSKNICRDLFAEKSTGFQKHLLEAIQFDGLEEGSIIDKKILILIGMQDGAFPRPEIDSSLDELDPKAPSRGEIDRFLFLEALSKTKEVFLISYLHTCPEKQIELPSSLVVQELQAYVEKWGGTIEVRALPERNFTQKSLEEAPYFSSSRFRRAKAYGESKKEDCKLFPDWHEEMPLPALSFPEETSIDLADLRLLLEDPIEFYFKKTLDFPIRWRDEKAFEEGEFLLPAYEKKKLLQGLLTGSMEEVFAEWKKQNGLPFGAFEEVSLQKFQKEQKNFEETVQRHQFTPEECKDMVISPWTIDLGDGQKVTLHGTIPAVSPRGIIELFGKDKKEIVLQRWGDLLVLKGHPELQQIPAQVFFLPAKKDVTKVVGSIDPQEELKKLLRYYALCRKRLSPFVPEWAGAFIKGEKEKLEKLLMGEKSYLPRYVQWLVARDGMPNVEVLCATWSHYLQTTFEAYAAI